MAHIKITSWSNSNNKSKILVDEEVSDEVVNRINVFFEKIRAHSSKGRISGSQPGDAVSRPACATKN